MIAGTSGDSSYCNYKDFGRNFYIWAEDQRWDEETCKELKEKYNIIFNGGVRPIMIVRRDGEGLDPLLIVGSEDDGTICFTRKYSTFDNAFDVGFTKSFIRNLKDAAEFAGVKIFEEGV